MKKSQFKSDHYARDNEPFRRYYSQHGEDYLLWKFFDFKPSGFFIEVGAFDGKYISNTYSFEENGWEGICIEPIPKYFELCKKNRPNSTCVNKAIVGDNTIDTIDFYQDEMGLYASCEYTTESEAYIKQCYEKDELTFNGIEKYKVKTATLNEILEQHKPDNVNIDFISIDVEGVELEVLKGFDINKYQPKILIIEANNEDIKEKIIKYIAKHSNYILAKQVNVNLFFVVSSNYNKFKSIKINCIIEKQIHPLGEKISISDLIQGVSIWNDIRIFPNTKEYIKNRLKDKAREVFRLENRLKNKAREVFRLENRLKNKEIILEDSKSKLKKLHNIEQENTGLKITNNNFNILKKSIESISNVSVKVHPLKKINAYKEMINVYNTIKSESKTVNTNQPTITIVTVVYNGEQEIEATIKSIIEQTYKDIEYIIIDGASTDNTLKIVKKYEDHITHWSSEKDSGIYDAMNKGIDLANGKWINFMNAGDTFADNDTLSKIVENIKENNDVIYGDRYYVKNDKKTLQKAKSIDTIFEKMPFGHQSVFIKNEVLKKFKFNDTYKFAADYNLLMQLYMKEYSFQYIPIPICNFISGGQSESGLRPYFEVLKILFDNCKDQKVIEKNIYFDAFRNNCESIINKSIKK